MANLLIAKGAMKWGTGSWLAFILGTMRRISWVLSILGLAGAILPAWAQDAPGLEKFEPPLPQPQKAVERKGRISGTVVCADTRKPARGAMVMVMMLPGAEVGEQNGLGQVGGQNMTRAGMDGSFLAEKLAPGEYTVIAMLPGYLSGLDALTGDDMRDQTPAKTRALLAKYGTVVVHGAETERLDVTLTRGAALSGRVIYADGSPATQVTIAVEDTKTKPPAGASPEDNIDVGSVMRMMFMHQSMGTDDQGRFRVAGLEAGTYRIAALQSGAAAGGNDADMAIMLGSMADTAAMHFYSGDTLHKSAAKTYELRPGDEVSDIVITIPETLFHQVRGSLTTVAGKGINQGTVTLKDGSDDALIFTSKLGQDGSFLFPMVPAGSYTLSSAKAQFMDMEAYQRQPRDPKNFKPPVPVSYADQSMGVIVKDGDVADLNLSLKELATAPDVAPTPP